MLLILRFEMKNYLELVKYIIDKGVDRGDRTGTGTRSVFGWQLRYDLEAGFPILTTKKVHFKSVAEELFWYIRGESSVKSLRERGVTIWDEWANVDGDLGPVYGVQWRRWQGKDGNFHDQLGWVIEEIKRNPNSRRLIVSAWNVADLHKMSLPPCHILFQFYVANNKLSCQMYQRSADVFLGLPFNISCYALLTHLVAEVTELQVGELIISLGDVHLYNNHFEQAGLQLERKPLTLPSFSMNRKITNIENLMFSDVELVDYQFHPSIKAPVAI